MRAVCVGDFRTSRSDRGRSAFAGTGRNVRFQRASSSRDEPVEVERTGIERLAIGEREVDVGTRQPQQAERELVFLRPLPARRHVVHRPLFRGQERGILLEKPLADERMVRVEAAKKSG